MTEAKLVEYIAPLIIRPELQRLWAIKDRGMPVFAHSIDVLLLALDAFPKWQAKFGSLNLAAIVIGSLVHDLSKLTTRDCQAAFSQPLPEMPKNQSLSLPLPHYSGSLSHTQLMSLHPNVAVEQIASFFDDLEKDGAPALDDQLREAIKHIVASHHGAYGLIPPKTPEAMLVHDCDYYSASHHRLAPLDANDILPLLSEGYRWTRVSALLGVGRELVRSRLRESCEAERVREWVDLMAIWREKGHVCPGNPERLRQLERVRHIVRVASQAPDSLYPSIHEAFVAASDFACAKTRGHPMTLSNRPTFTGSGSENGPDNRSERGAGESTLRPALVL